MKMNLQFSALLSAVLLAAVPPAVLSGSLECQGNFITPGVTEEQLLAACGNPTSRDGDNWIYAIPGSFPMAVTLGNGVVMFIRDASEIDSPSDPLGDSP